jgi:sec-independent protein translocase protein TatC
LFDFGSDTLVPLTTGEEYFSFIIPMVLTFGLGFELPIVILAAFGIVAPAFLSKYRRHAILLIVLVGAFLTPRDAVATTIALSVPVYALYELSVIASHVVYKRSLRGAVLALLLAIGATLLVYKKRPSAQVI